MFVLSEMRDIVSILPHQLKNDLKSVITLKLNKRFANKVIIDLGLCICLFDLIEIGDTYLLPGDGRGHIKVKFRFIVFRPFVEEIIEAKVIASSKLGLTLSVNFFEDIFIPAHSLPAPHVFEENEQLWYWEYQQEDDEPPAKLYLDPGKVVRFRVVENIFKDIKPDLSDEEAKKQKSFEIIGSMSETGLGCTSWWTQGGEEEEDDQMEE
ncbi:unnamed protein product, partial [Mesorhabditis belari]|uniref:DNA-directed RNA polymerase III subunit RPC8 n=1 Tax=Mesorhabditis belari TaxID=2138241 RepID=A0AAF3FCQ9_9BILA